MYPLSCIFFFPEDFQLSFIDFMPLSLNIGSQFSFFIMLRMPLSVFPYALVICCFFIFDGLGNQKTQFSRTLHKTISRFEPRALFYEQTVQPFVHRPCNIHLFNHHLAISYHTLDSILGSRNIAMDDKTKSLSIYNLQLFGHS